jgi:hypothetical protein
MRVSSRSRYLFSSIGLLVRAESTICSVSVFALADESTTRYTVTYGPSLQYGYRRDRLITSCQACKHDLECLQTMPKEIYKLRERVVPTMFRGI